MSDKESTHRERLISLIKELNKELANGQYYVEKPKVIPPKDTFTISEISRYLLTQDSLGDIHYNLSAENIKKANEPKDEEE